MSISRMGYERDLCWTFLSEILFGSMIIPHVLDIHAHDEADLPPPGTGTHRSRVGIAHRQRLGSARTMAVGGDRPDARAVATKIHAPQRDQSSMRVASRCVSFCSDTNPEHDLVDRPTHSWLSWVSVMIIGAARRVGPLSLVDWAS